MNDRPPPLPPSSNGQKSYGKDAGVDSYDLTLVIIGIAIGFIIGTLVWAGR